MSAKSTPTAAAVRFTVAELAGRLGGEVEGDATASLVGVCGLEDAGPEHLSFLANRKYARALGTSRAGAVLVDRTTRATGRTLIRCEDPYAAFARALALFNPQPWPEPGIDPRAAVAADAVLGAGVTVEAFAWIGPGARIGAGCWIEAGAYVGAGARLGERCRLMTGSVVYGESELGDRVWLNPGAVIGAEGFGFAPRRDGHVKIPQTGRAVLGADVEVGANSCVDRATMGDTVVGAGSKLDNLVQVGHGSHLGEGVLMAAYAGIAGSARIGRGVVFAAKSGASNHLVIGDGTVLAAQSLALSDQEPGAQLAGTPAIDRTTWQRASVAFARLPQLLARVRELERRLAALESAAGKPD
jgi:UDP-3-O-[3-hydroxymyristoyl] glucosamine N-acyltransferase